MEEIQNLKKRTNFPPITLEELNDYTEGNKDKYINQSPPSFMFSGPIMGIFSDSTIPSYIYYLKSHDFEMIGYIDTIKRKRMIFLPFYKRNRGNPIYLWYKYNTNYELNKDNNPFEEIKPLGLNNNPEFAAEEDRKYRETIANEENIEAIKKQPKGTLDEAEKKTPKDHDNTSSVGVEMAQENINRIQTQLAEVKPVLEEAISDPDGPGENYETIKNRYLALKEELKEALKNRGDLGGRRRKTIRRKSKRKSKRKYKRK